MTSLAGVLTTLCSSTGNGTYSGSTACGVNSAGQIVGNYSGSNVANTQPFCVTINSAGSVLSAVDILGQGSAAYYSTFGSANANSVSANGLTLLYGVAYAINNGTIVGFEDEGTANVANEYAFVSSTTPGTMVALQTLVPDFASSNFASGRLSVADDLDAAGDIAGVGVTNSGAQDAYLATPIVAYNPGDANLDGRVDINDLTIVLGNYGQSGKTWTQGSMDGDPAGTVDVNDLSIVLANYGTTYASSSGVSPVPEPTCAVLLASAMLQMAIWSSRHSRTKTLAKNGSGPALLFRSRLCDLGPRCLLCRRNRQPRSDVA